MGRNAEDLRATLARPRYAGKITYEEFQFIADSPDSVERKAWRIVEKSGTSMRQAHRWLVKYQEEKDV